MHVDKIQFNNYTNSRLKVKKVYHYIIADVQKILKVTAYWSTPMINLNVVRFIWRYRGLYHAKTEQRVLLYLSPS